MIVSLPETSSDNILLRRARRLRAVAAAARAGSAPGPGRSDLIFQSASEVKQEKMSPGQIAVDALIKPWQINVLDPAVLFTTIYTALIYGIYYSFFEAFPLVYGDVYGFDLGEIGLAFLSVLVGLVVAVALYCSYFYFYADARMEKKTSLEQEEETTVPPPPPPPPEARLWPGLVATFFIPIGLFIFGTFAF